VIELIKSKNVSKYIGDYSSWSASTDIDNFKNTSVWYAGGIEIIDSNYKVTKPRQVSIFIYKHKEGLNFEIFEGMFGNNAIFIKDKELSKITFSDSKVVSKQRMGALGKGLIGGALLGPAGLLLGAVKGHSDSTKDANTSIIVSFYFERNNEKHNLLLEIGPKAKNKFLGFLDHNYRDLLKEESDDEIKQDSVDVATEIEKFHKLKESGIITEEEFEKKKTELLGL
jgi:hypothetical protein